MKVMAAPLHTLAKEYCGSRSRASPFAKGSPGYCYPRRAKCYIIASSRCADPTQSLATHLHGLLEVSLDWILLNFVFPALL